LFSLDRMFFINFLFVPSFFFSEKKISVKKSVKEYNLLLSRSVLLCIVIYAKGREKNRVIPQFKAFIQINIFDLVIFLIKII